MVLAPRREQRPQGAKEAEGEVVALAEHREEEPEGKLGGVERRHALPLPAKTHGAKDEGGDEQHPRRFYRAHDGRPVVRVREDSQALAGCRRSEANHDGGVKKGEKEE